MSILMELNWISAQGNSQTVDLSIVSDDIPIIGGNITLACSYAANYMEQSIEYLRWTKDGKTVATFEVTNGTNYTRTVSPKFHLVTDGIYNGHLTISHLETSDGGKYMCEVGNGINASTHSLPMRVHTPCKFS